MTQDEIIEMAKQAGFVLYEFDNGTTPSDIRYERFAKLVAQHEQKKFCAVLRQLHDSYSLASDSNAIRARGQE
jgi:hypothetical protein